MKTFPFKAPDTPLLCCPVSYCVSATFVPKSSLELGPFVPNTDYQSEGKENEEKNVFRSMRPRDHQFCNGLYSFFMQR